MNYLLFTLYLILLCWMLLRVPFIKNAGISPKLILGLFLIKVLAGIAIGWISIHMYGPGNDYWDLNDYAREEYQLLITNPGKYLLNIFNSNYTEGYTGFFNSDHSYWNDLETNIIIKLVSVFNIFSRGNYYINSLFFNFLVFFGHVILYRLFIHIYPQRKIGVILGCFLLPSTLYFASGIHKDGIVFLILAVLIYSVYQSLHKNRFSIKRMLLIGISLAGLFFLRSFIFLALVPALFAWVFSVRAKWHTGISFMAVYLFCALVFFNSSSINSKIRPLDIITNKQAAYKNLPIAATQMALSTLQPNLKSFAVNAPEAFNHSLLRPYLWELPVRSLLPLSIELFFYHILFLLFIFFREKDINRNHQPYLFFAIFFTLTVFLVIGYIVPNLGSLVRYRSLYLPLVITPLLCSVNWKKLFQQFNITKYNI